MLRQTNPRAIELSGYIECLTVYIEKAIPAARVEEAAGRLNLNDFESNPECETTGCMLGHYHVAMGREMFKRSQSGVIQPNNWHVALCLAYEELGGESGVDGRLFGSAEFSLGVRKKIAEDSIEDFQSELDAITAGVAA